MKLLDIISGQWAITGDVWQEIQALYFTHMRGEKIDIKGLEAKVGMPFHKARQAGYDVVDGKAILDVTDVLTPDLNLFSLLFGGTSTKQLISDAVAAMEDPSVNELIFRFNTPGGTVTGMFEALQALSQMKGQKPMIGIAEGMVASAGYLLATAMDRLYISSNTVQVGSIGVIWSHKDMSRALESAGIKVTDISSGGLKGIGSPYRPMTDVEKAIVQADVQEVAGMFFDAVSAARGISVDNITALQGGVLRGRKAIEAGLVDGVSTMDELLNGNKAVKSMTGGVRAGAKIKAKEGLSMMTKEEFMAAHPELYQAVVAEGKAGMDAAAAMARTEGVEAERARILGIDALNMPGHEKMIAEFKADGKTQPGEAAVKILAAEKSKGASHLQALIADAAAVVVPAANAPATGAEGAGAEAKGFEALVSEYVAEHKCSKAVAMSAVAKAHPAEHEAFIKKANA